MKNTIIVDMDGTLSDATHRAELAQQGYWDFFHEASIDDPICNEVAEFCKMASDNGYELIILTGRNEKFREITKEWLVFKSVRSYFDEILMRPDNDFSKDVDMKIALLEGHFGSKEKVLENVLFCLDDRDGVVEGFRDYGLACWQVKQGDY